MNTYNIINFLFIFLFLSPYSFFFREKAAINKINEFTIYFIKQNWHTAIVFETKDLNPDIFCEYKNFKYYNLIDIGWGDEEFYQYPDFDWELAYRALFYPTPSTLRIEGIFISPKQYFNISEIVVELKINNEQLRILLNYIADTIWKDKKKEHKIFPKGMDSQSTQYLNRVYFFKANGEYHLFNTCNT